MPAGDAPSRLEGSSSTRGGLEIRKKSTDGKEKYDNRSHLGLDKLAREKKDDTRKRKIEETPDHGVSDSVRRGIERYHDEHSRGGRRGLEEDSRKKRDRNDDERRREDRRDRDRYGSSRRDRRRDDDTPFFKVPDTPSKSAWDVDDGERRYSKRSEWDTPTPSIHRRERGPGDTERSVGSVYRSERRRKEDERHNRHRRPEDSVRSMRDDPIPHFADDSERLAWEEDQKNLDREWYDNDGGFDDEHNPFNKCSEEFVKKKEMQWSEKTSKQQRLTVRQQQIKRENEMWENNRLHRSGVVAQIGDQSFVDDETDENRVHLLVHNMVPPFLDGRIVFTKQAKPVLPVVDTTCDMAVAAARGSKVVRQFRDSEERKKAQDKHWELAGSNLGNLMGIKEKPDETADPEDDGGNFRESHQFASHMKGVGDGGEKNAKK